MTSIAKPSSWIACAVAMGFSAGAFAVERPKPGPDVPMRGPFVLNLQVDKEHYYEQNMPAIPYVYENGIYVMKGDRFGVSLEVVDGKLREISYQPDWAKADVTFEFKQVLDADPNGMMLLTIHNRTSHQLQMRALMTVPGQKNAVETSMLPVEPGLTNFESWPHPIVQLLLHDLTFGK